MLEDESFGEAGGLKRRLVVHDSGARCPGGVFRAAAVYRFSYA
jgi:hypothetical protein